MAECLVALTDGTPVPGSEVWQVKPDAKALAKDLRARRRAGDIVAVRDDGWTWGKLEGPPMFGILAFPGVPANTIAAWAQPEVETKTVEILPGVSIQAREVMRKLSRRLAVNALSVAARNALFAGRCVVGTHVQAAVVRALIRDRSGAGA